MWLSVSGSSTRALAGDELQVALCGSSAGGVPLGPGRHVLEATPGQRTGWNVDQIALDSAPGGRPETAGPGGQLPSVAQPAGPRPSVHVVSQDDTGATVTVKATGSPFWLVLGESVDRGWTASVDGGPSLGSPTLVDGFANGWRIDPAAVKRATHDGVLTVRIDCRPDAKSTWRWWCRPPGPSCASSSPCGRAAATGAGGPDAVAAAPDGPVLASPFRSAPWATTTARAAVATGVATGIAVELLVRPWWIGMVVTLGVLAGLRWRRGRAALTAGAVGCIVATGVAMVVAQATAHDAPGALRAPHFDGAGDVAWAAIALLAADAVLEARRRRARVNERPGSS